MPPLLSLWILACAAKPPSNAAALERVASAAEKAPPNDLSTTLLDGLLAPGVGDLPEACTARLREARAATDPSGRAMAYATALRDLCPPTCASDVLADLANYAPDQQVPALIAACDAKGADPVFGAPLLRDLRPKMDGMDYLLARMILDPVFHATDGTPLGARYTALIPTLADTMLHVPKVKIGRPAVSGGLDETDVGFRLSDSQYALEDCYKGALRTDPTLQGTVQVTILVDAVGRTIPGVDGQVPDALLRCADQVVRDRWAFQAPAGDDLGRISVSISFHPG